MSLESRLWRTLMFLVDNKVITSRCFLWQSRWLLKFVILSRVHFDPSAFRLHYKIIFIFPLLRHEKHLNGDHWTVLVLLFQIWICEFCSSSNTVDILAGEVPTMPDVTYMITPAPSTVASTCAGTDESMVIFCVDISGSMCVSQEVGSILYLLTDIGVFISVWMNATQ